MRTGKPSLKSTVLEEALDAGADLDLRGAPGLADGLDVDRDVLLEDGRDLHVRRGRGRGFLLAAAAHGGQQGNQDQTGLGHCLHVHS